MNISSQPPNLSPLMPGYWLDQYELLCPIAEGGMAAVWLARKRGKRGFKKLVAIKTILPKYAAERGFQEMFLDEARVASRIEHVNVVQVLDLGEQRDVLYLVLEWVDGDSLLKVEKKIANKRLCLPQAILLRILSDACLGLHAAHELCDDDGKALGVVHRDVSPQNILVSAKGTTKVIDFGIAKARDRLTGDTTGCIKGKLMYMAPEQALGKRVDRRADIWGIAAVYYRIVKGKAPFEASSPLETMELLQRGQLVDSLALAPNVHRAVRDVMEAALSPGPGGRFATAFEMHAALEAAMVKSGARASATDVEAYLARHLPERRAARREALHDALRAAAQRERAPKPSPVSWWSRGRLSISIDELHGACADPSRADGKRDVTTRERQGATIRPGEVTVRPGEITIRPGEATLRPGEVTLRPGEVTLRPGEIRLPPGGMVTLPPDEAATLRRGEPTSALRPEEAEEAATVLQGEGAAVRRGEARTHPSATPAKRFGPPGHSLDAVAMTRRESFPRGFDGGRQSGRAANRWSWLPYPLAFCLVAALAALVLQRTDRDRGADLVTLSSSATRSIGPPPPPYEAAGVQRPDDVGEPPMVPPRASRGAPAGTATPLLAVSRSTTTSGPPKRITPAAPSASLSATTPAPPTLPIPPVREVHDPDGT